MILFSEVFDSIHQGEITDKNNNKKVVVGNDNVYAQGH